MKTGIVATLLAAIYVKEDWMFQRSGTFLMDFLLFGCKDVKLKEINMIIVGNC